MIDCAHASLLFKWTRYYTFQSANVDTDPSQSYYACVTTKEQKSVYIIEKGERVTLL